MKVVLNSDDVTQKETEMIRMTEPVDDLFQAGDRVLGYDVRRVAVLKELRCVFYELEHAGTGARHIHIRNDDAENTFSVAFKTVPRDSTGVAHILEHTALCGSGDYPVRDPFFSMLKRSLSTFMNAFTASDWTMYPFCTQTPKDYYNLMGVYLDAAFFPNLDELSFMQEGHRLEIEESNPVKLVYKGVVYNEMKGAMSSPDQVMSRSLLNALFTDTTYRFNSGGDPAVIPGLTWDQLKHFHSRHYHPSNAYFYTYGNLPLKDHLQFIQDKVLNRFTRIDPGTEVPSQPRWQAPRKATYYYSLDKNQDASQKSQACVTWLTCDTTRSYEVLILSLLGEILLGNSASPLRKALMDSGLGSSLSDGSGFDADCRDALFSCGLKDIHASNADRIQTLIFDTLKKLVKDGIDKELIESAIHQIEFHRKEVTNTPYPYGLKLLMGFAGTWLHGGDPEEILELDALMDKLKAAIAREPFLEKCIQAYLLDNPHRVLLTLEPDSAIEEKENQRVAAELAAVAAGLSESDLARLAQNAQALQARQETMEDVSCLPTLAIADIPRDVRVITPLPAEKGSPVLYYDQSTAGIVYVSAASGAGGLSGDMQPLVPFFCYALPRSGTALRDYTELTRLIDRYTGGIAFSTHARMQFDETGASLPLVTVNGKCLVRNVDRLFEIICEILSQHRFTDRVRLKMLLQEYQAGMESMIVQNGHRLAISLSSRRFSDAGRLNESWHGIHQLKTIQALTQDLSDPALDALAAKLSDIGGMLFSRSNLKLALIGETQPLSAASHWPDALYHELPEGKPAADGPPTPEEGEPGLPHEGWSTSSAVSFVALSFETVRMSHPDAPALMLISKMSRSLYLHREIREKGGAYGGMSIYTPEDGVFSFASYRDPHIVSTLKAFSGAMDFMASGDYSAEDIKEGILQVCADIDKPDSPGPAAKKAFYRTIVSLSDELRRRFKHDLLALTREDVMRVSRKYLDPLRIQKGVAIISGEDKLKAASQKLTDNPLSLYRI
jgi:Zn-dependent M16 (insulinase) family peptidase